MLVLLLSWLAFGGEVPLRGSTMVAMTSWNLRFTLAGRTLNLVSTGTLGNCSNQLVSIRELQETTGYDAFPSDSRAQFLQVRTPIAIHQMNQNQLHTGCPYGVERRPSTGFRFLSTGAAPWVAWNDTILAQDTLQTGSGWVRQLKNIRIHWVWSAYDSARPWVRWSDTLDQASGSGVPLLTLTRSVRIDSIVPTRAQSGEGSRRIALQVQFDSARSWSMSFDGSPATTVPPGLFPAGTNLRLDTRIITSGPDPFLCRIWSGGRVMDSVFVRPAPPVGVAPRAFRFRTPATGRSFDAGGRTLSPETRTDLSPTYHNPSPRDPGNRSRDQSLRESMQSP